MARRSLRSLKDVVADKFDGADFNFGAFVNFEDEDDGVARGDAFVLRSHRGELVAVLAF